jgi:hypothetical protein
MQTILRNREACMKIRCSLCLILLSLAPCFSAAQPGHVNDVNAVLYAGIDQKTGVYDIFAVDPISGKTINLTEGRAAMTPDWWGQPWEPVGSQYKVAFRQYGVVDNKFQTRFFIVELKGNNKNIYQIAGTFGLAGALSWSNDNQSCSIFNAYFAEDSSVKFEVAVIKNNQVDARIQLPPEFTYNAFGAAKWSPDGKWIALIDSPASKLYLISTEDYSMITIPLTGSVGSSFVWGPDGRRLAVVLDKKLSIIDLAGTVLQTFGIVNEVEDWSADGKAITYMTRKPYPLFRQCTILFLGGSEEIDSGYTDESTSKWSPDSDLIAFWTTNSSSFNPAYLMVVDPDGNNPKVIGQSNGWMGPSWIKLPTGMLAAAK